MPRTQDTVTVVPPEEPPSLDNRMFIEYPWSHSFWAQGSEPPVPRPGMPMDVPGIVAVQSWGTSSLTTHDHQALPSPTAGKVL